MKKLVLIACASLTGCGGGGGDNDNPPTPAELYEPAQRFTVRQGEGMITYTSTDPQTPERTIRIRVRVPEGATGPLPAIVILHGGGFVNMGHNNLAGWGNSLAEAGYVTINTANADDEGAAHCPALQIPLAECNGPQFMKEVSDGGTLPAAMYTRPNDAKAVLDRLPMIASVAGVTIDTSRLGVLGHSGGSHAVMVLAGAVTDVSPSIHDMPLREPRFRAYVANSPQGIGHTGMTATSWDRIAVPMLIQTGKADNHNGELVTERLEAYDHLRGPNAYLNYVDSDAATHGFFSLSEPMPVGEQTYIATTALAFFDAYVRERREAIDWLASDALSEATEGVSTLTVK